MHGQMSMKLSIIYILKMVALGSDVNTLGQGECDHIVNISLIFKNVLCLPMCGEKPQNIAIMFIKYFNLIVGRGQYCNIHVVKLYDFNMILLN